MEYNEDRMNGLGFRLAQFEMIMLAPWELEGTDFKRLYRDVPAHSPINPHSYYMLYCLAKQCLSLPGIFMECGVFRGGSAAFFARLMVGSGKELHLFDTFEGMPDTDALRDTLHVKGDFSDTSLEEVRKTVGHPQSVTFHKGWVPDTFEGFDPASIAFAHVDVDIYQSVKDCCEFIYPRLPIGGVMVFDDYGHYTCPGATEAVNEYFSDKRSVPLPLFSGQGVVVKV